MSVELHLVSRWETERVVPILGALKALLEKFVEAWPGDDTYESLCEAIDSGNTQLWVAFEDGVPKFLLLGRLKTIEANGLTRYILRAGVGEFRESELHRLDDIERYAAKRGASEVEMTTRPGLCRLLKRRGYTTLSERMRKPIGNGMRE